jgi:leader peptidase (prepilin peptidase)/N-methyltransferase
VWVKVRVLLRVLVVFGGVAACAAALVVVVLVGAAAGLSPGVTFSAGYVAAVTVPLVVMDLREHRLPDAMVMPGYVFAAAGMILAAAARGIPPWEGVAVLAVALLLLGAMASAGGLGMGDVKLGGMLALALGVSGSGVASVLLAGGAAFVTAGVVAAVGVRGGRRGTGMWRSGRDRIPFGPFLLAGFWVAVVGGV